MATAARKTAASPKVVLSTLKTPEQIKTEALDAFIKAEAAADKASKKKGTAKAALMAVTKHGERVFTSDGLPRDIQNEVVSTNQHEKVALALAAQYGVTEAELKKLYKSTAGTRKVQEVKKP